MTGFDGRTFEFVGEVRLAQPSLMSLLLAAFLAPALPSSW